MRTDQEYAILVSWYDSLGNRVNDTDHFEGDEIQFEPEGLTHFEWWHAQLQFPRPSIFSDVQMEVFFRNRDGKWSDQTKAAVTRHKAVGLDLNDNWALVWKLWSCPSCRRTKNQIFRLSKRSVLLAKLECHHDHMADIVWPRAQAILGENWRDNAESGTTNILDTLKDLVTRFSECLICSECNNADGNVKRHFRDRIDPRFTFTALEIAQFVNPTSNGLHELNYDKALSIWHAQKPAFESRVTLLDSLLENLKKGFLARELLGSTGANPMGTILNQSKLLWKAFYADAKETEKLGLLSGLRDEFINRSTCRDSAKFTRVDGTQPVCELTDEEFNAYVDVVSRKRWLAISDDWSCPVCARSKREVLRKSKKGKWSGGIRGHREFIDELNQEIINMRRQLFPDFCNKVWVAQDKHIDICSDCSAIGTRVVQRDRSLGHAYLKIEEMRASILEIKANREHAIDEAQVTKFIKKNEPYWSADEALRALNAKASTFSTKADFWARNGTPHEEIISELSFDLRIDNGISDPDACRPLVLWLIEQGKLRTAIEES